MDSLDFEPLLPLPSTIRLGEPDIIKSWFAVRRPTFVFGAPVDFDAALSVS